MSTTKVLLEQYEGHIVSWALHPSFVILSLLVSFIGAVSTLELINRRTSGNGLRNHAYLVGAAITMGGIAVHFIGNRAIVLAQNQPELQIAYSSGYTAFSFLLIITVLITAFIAAGANNDVSIWRICVGGTLAGGAMCGMHYVGNASIANYTCEYTLANVFGSVIIAVVASNAALLIFFRWRASWTDSWWRRGLSAVILSLAVSGMHWCASTGTNYRLMALTDKNQFSRNTIVMVFILLSFSVALVVVAVVAHETWAARKNIRKARNVVLAAAIFDDSGRILVRPDGWLPSEKITHAYIEKTPGDTFSIENPLFQWMFQASRNWNNLNGMIANMANHVARLPSNKSGRSVRLIRENGQLIEDYDIVFRELFCLAAASLATRLKEPLPNVGVLWDGMLPTGRARKSRSRENLDAACERGESASIRESSSGLGSLMFLVRRVENLSDLQKLEAAGFRFADIRQVSPIIRSGMQIETPNVNQILTDMAAYTGQSTMIDPMVHLGFFGVRARLYGYGFDILVEEGARNRLPASKLPLEHLEPWHIEFLRQYDGFKIPSLHQSLMDVCRGRSPSEADFASSLADAISALRSRIGNLFDDAIFSCRTVQVPCQPRLGSAGARECTMIVLHSMIPIHHPLDNLKCEFVPLNFFKLHQMMYKDSPYQAAFIQHLHRELIPAIKEMPTTATEPSGQQSSRLGTGSLLGLDNWRGAIVSLFNTKRTLFPSRAERRLHEGESDQTNLGTFKLWDLGRGTDVIFSETAPSTSTGTSRGTRYAPSLGGILVSQEIKVAISQAEEMGSRPSHDRPHSRDPSLLLSRYTSAPSPQRIDQTGDEAGTETDSKTDMGRQPGLELIATTADIDTQVEQALVSTVVASGSAKEMETFTFVDELFSICIKLR
ncbi:hypothetical protein O1611_g1162 [Lasiodiplodia mahajangana]|uniref:Uncharacterized protein n=1 Tax=Lasiodiplodia mahajangana TaxID=1108764 RepID=A0ACC2JYP7_9PEZI|nr:hypothetical protein O1611_g1162 [Lasiodiplodia mahajangana]